MVFATIVIVGVAGAMLGWNVHVMRKHGVSSRSVLCVHSEQRACLASAHNFTCERANRSLRVDADGTQALMPRAHISRLSRLRSDRTRERRCSHVPNEGGIDTRFRCLYVCVTTVYFTKFKFLLRTHKNFFSVATAVFATPVVSTRKRVFLFSPRLTK